MTNVIDKIYTFKRKNENITFDDAVTLFESTLWNIDYVNALAERMNEVKSQLNDKEIGEWGRHTSYTDSSSYIRRDIINKVGDERSPELLTRAWIKFYEILSTQGVVCFEEVDTEQVKGLFLCEAPGAFITAANHFIKTQHKSSPVNTSSKFEWFASTLNPYYEASDVFGAAIIDDSLIAHPIVYKNWLFGEDNTGNILSASFFRQLSERNCQFDFVTADGGVNCASNPSEQELQTLPLLFAETLAALQVLKPRGTFVLKAFSLLECQSICLLYLLYASFEELRVCKPLASKAGNSELYIICRGYEPNVCQSLLSPLLSALLLTNFNIVEESALFAKAAIPMHFLLQFQECVTMFVHYQKIAIESNLITFSQQLGRSAKLQLHNDKKAVSRLFFRKCPIIHIDVDETLTKNYKLSRLSEQLGFDLMRLEMFVRLAGSYQERTQGPSVDHSAKLFSELESVVDLDTVYKKFAVFKHIVSVTANVELNYVRGHSFKDVICSKFCDQSLLALHRLYGLQCDEMPLSIENRTSHQHSREALAMVLKNHLDELNLSSHSIIYNDSRSEALASELKTFAEAKTNIFNGQQVFASHFAGGILESSVLSKQSSPNASKIFVIDTLETSSSLNIKDDEKLAPYALHYEHYGILILLKQLIPILTKLDEQSVLIIRLRTALSRLTVNVLYLISRTLDRYAALPCPLQSSAQSCMKQLNVPGKFDSDKFGNDCGLSARTCHRHYCGAQLFLLKLSNSRKAARLTNDEIRAPPDMTTCTQQASPQLLLPPLSLALSVASAAIAAEVTKCQSQSQKESEKSSNAFEAREKSKHSCVEPLEHEHSNRLTWLSAQVSYILSELVNTATTASEHNTTSISSDTETSSSQVLLEVIPTPIVLQGKFCYACVC